MKASKMNAKDRVAVMARTKDDSVAACRSTSKFGDHLQVLRYKRITLISCTVHVRPVSADHEGRLQIPSWDLTFPHMSGSHGFSNCGWVS